MAEKIGGYPRAGTETRPAGNNSAGGVKRAPQSSTEGSQTVAGSDAVSLTETVTRLQSIEARIRELPDVDRERVEDIRRQIDSGSFEVDSKLIAKRLVQLEQALT